MCPYTKYTFSLRLYVITRKSDFFRQKHKKNSKIGMQYLKSA